MQNVRRLLSALGILTFALSMSACISTRTPKEVATPQRHATAEPDDLYDESADAQRVIAGAVERAKHNHTRVLIQWGADWCIWCHRLADMLSENENVQKKLNDEYEWVLVNVGQRDENVNLAKSYGVDVHQEGLPYLTVLDGDGRLVRNQETGSLELSDGSNSGHDPEKVLAFLTAYQTPRLDARAELNRAVSEARERNTRVLLYFSAPWCAWCHRLDEWLHRPEVHALMTKDFVLAKIDVERMIHGQEQFERYAKGEQGLPFFVFVGQYGETITNSVGPEGNLGFPYTDAEISEFSKKLVKASSVLTPKEVQSLIRTLEHREDAH